MKDRIKLIMDEQHLTQQSFSQLLGISPAQLCGIFKDRTKPTLNIVDAIHQKFPQISLTWLLYGIGPMYINNESPQDDNSGGSSPSLQQGTNVEGLALNFGGDESEAAPTVVGDLSDGSASAGVVNNRRIPNSQVAQGSLFDPTPLRGVNATPKNVACENVKYIDKHQRKITEIRVFYDDQTWETFVPKKS